MASLPKPRLTPEQYLDIERRADFKSEYLSGEMFAMAGASRRHNLIAGNLIYLIKDQLINRQCQTYPSGMKVEVGPFGLFAYPDVTITCAEPKFHDDHLDMLLNPSVIFEVLSPSTSDCDRGVKFIEYRRLESLTDYAMVSQNEYRVEHYTRQPDGRWLLSELVGRDATMDIESVFCRLPLADIYAQVAFGDGD